MLIQLLRKYRFLWLALSGLLSGLGLVIPEIGFICWVSLVPFCAVIMDASSDKSIKQRRIFLYAFSFFFSFGLVVYHWFFYMYPLEFTDVGEGAAAVIVALAWLGLSLVIALEMSPFALLYAYAVRGKRVGRVRYVQPFVFAAGYSVFEFLQAHIGYVGVPWGRLALSQVDIPLGVKSSAVFGSYFVTFLILLANAALACVLLYADKKRVTLTVAASALLCNFLVGGAAAIVDAVAKDTSEQKIKVAVIQGNVSSREAWTTESYELSKEVYRKYSLMAAEDGAEIILWPETAFPYNIERNQDFAQYTKDLARECDATILASAFTTGEISGMMYNSIVEVDENGVISETVYSKRNLVPFGEFVPMREFVTLIFPPLADIGMLSTELLWGNGANVFDTACGNVGALICFDSIYEDNARDSVKNGAEILAVSTNDSWFGDSAATYMHNAQSRLRAVETGRYVFRAANTGVSSVITSDGEVLDILPPMTDGYIVEEVVLSSKSTVYSVIGNAFVYILAAGLMTVLLVSPLENIISKRNGRVAS